MVIGDFPSDVESKPCRTCGASMPIGASKCTKCSSYQNWYQNVSISTSVLALLTALVSVVTTTVPGFWSWIRSGQALLEVDFSRDDTEGGIYLSASNYGDRAATVRGVTVDFTIGSKHFTYDAFLDQGGNPVIDPGKPQTLRYTIDVGTELQPYKVGQVTGKCIIKVLIGRGADIDTQSLPRDCKDIRPLDFGR